MDGKDDHLPKSSADLPNSQSTDISDAPYDNLHDSIEKFCEIFKDVTPTVNEEAVLTYDDTEDVRGKPYCLEANIDCHLL